MRLYVSRPRPGAPSAKGAETERAAAAAFARESEAGHVATAGFAHESGAVDTAETAAAQGSGADHRAAATFRRDRDRKHASEAATARDEGRTERAGEPHAAAFGSEVESLEESGGSRPGSPEGAASESGGLPGVSEVSGPSGSQELVEPFVAGEELDVWSALGADSPGEDGLSGPVIVAAFEEEPVFWSSEAATPRGQSGGEAAATTAGGALLEGFIPEPGTSDLDTWPADPGSATVPETDETELPPLDPAAEAPAPGEEELPPLRLGSEAARAEAAFRLEEQLLRGESATEEAWKSAADRPLTEGEVEAESIEAGLTAGDSPEAAFIAPTLPKGDPPEAASIEAALATGHSPLSPSIEGAFPTADWPAAEAGPAAEPVVEAFTTGSGAGGAEIEIDIVFEERVPEHPVTSARSGLECRIPRTVLLLGATPLLLRRLLLEALAAPVAEEGRGVLLLESASPLDDASGMLEFAFERTPATLRRNLGVPARDLLLHSPSERKALFDALSADERRSDLVVIDLELPESILCSRLLFLVDQVVVALTSNETSIYEAYRALRGLPERRPGIEIFALSIARSRQEADFLFDRFSAIAKEFLRMPARDGGWLAIPDASVDPPLREVPVTTISAALAETLRSAPARDPSRRDFIFEGNRSFFDHLGDWFGPA